MEFMKALASRRSQYALSAEAVIDDAVLESAVADVLRLTPSAYDARSQRLVLLFGKRHAELWTIVLEALRAIVPAADFAKTERKIKGFAAGRGTVLFFDDTTVTEGLATSYPLYAANFRVWAREQGGMLQGNVWVALAERGYGASLQHYSELIEESVRKAFDLPAGWKLVAQMPFGKVVAAPREKTPDELSVRMRVLK